MRLRPAETIALTLLAISATASIVTIATYIENHNCANCGFRLFGKCDHGRYY